MAVKPCKNMLMLILLRCHQTVRRVKVWSWVSLNTMKWHKCLEFQKTLCEATLCEYTGNVTYQIVLMTFHFLLLKHRTSIMCYRPSFRAKQDLYIYFTLCLCTELFMSVILYVNLSHFYGLQNMHNLSILLWLLTASHKATQVLKNNYILKYKYL